LAGPQVADDLTGEVFVVAFARRASYEPDRGTVRVWLFGIARNMVRSQRRATIRSQRTLARLATQLSEGLRFDERERLESTFAALGRMRPSEREVLLLHAWEGLLYEEIAAVLGVPIGTVELTTRDEGRDDRLTTIAVEPPSPESGPAATLPRDTTPDAPPTSVSAHRCGDTLPFTLDVPVRFGSSIAGTAPGSPAPRDDQLVLHWVSGPTVYEVRWPIDESVRRQMEQSNRASRGGGFSGGSTIVPPHVVSSVPCCEAVQLTAYEADRERALDTVIVLHEIFIRSVRPLVIETRPVEVLPDVIPCNAPANVAHVTKKESPVSMPAQTSAREALTYFRRELAPPGGIPGRDLVEFLLPDGRIGYGRPMQPAQTPEKFIVVVSLALDAAGWRVVHWWSSGC
jgi:RNA polymerase sigma factor (sigma-70 family)